MQKPWDGNMFQNERILLVEDDNRLASLIKKYLEQQNFNVSVEERGDRAVGRILDENPDLVILDLMLPGRDGLSVCQAVRPNFHNPVLILTAKEDDMDQVAGLELGADDYVKKPIEPRVLLARIRALFRRTLPGAGNNLEFPRNPSDNTMEFGNLRICRNSRSVYLEGRIVDLTTNEFELLWLLASDSGRVLNRDSILEALRGINYDGMDRSVDVCISRLRKKLGDDSSKPRKIKTVWGQGYLFVKDAWTK